MIDTIRIAEARCVGRRATSRSRTEGGKEGRQRAGGELSREQRTASISSARARHGIGKNHRRTRPKLRKTFAELAVQA